MKLFGWLRRQSKSYRIIGSRGVSAWSSFWNLLSGTRHDYAAEAGRLYDNSVVGPAINWYWRNFLYLQFIIEKPIASEKELKWQEVPGHPAVQAIESSIYYDDSILWYGTLLSWLVRGNAYWLKIRSAAGLVVGYVYVPHFQIWPMADKYNDGTRLVTYYLFTPIGGVPIEVPVEDVVHFRYGVDPENQACGISPLYSAIRDIVGDNTAATISNALMRNGGMVGICFSPKADAIGEEEITPEQEQKWLSKWRRYTTGDFAGTPMLMPFPMDAQTVGQPLDKLAVDVLRQIGAAHICANFGIDPMVIGLPSATKTYSNYKEANEAAYEQALLPTAKILAKQLTSHLRRDFPGAETYRCGWNTSEVRALQPDIDDLHERAREDYFRGIITRAEAKRMIKEEFGPADNVYIQEVAANMNSEQAALKRALLQQMQSRRRAFEELQTDDGDE